MSRGDTVPSVPGIEDVRAAIARELPGLIEIRHDLHAHPELGYKETRTCGVVVRELTRLGIRHKAGLAGGTGVVAHIPATEKGAPAESIGLRADMDALPIVERTGAAYASINPGVMHACGHDGHTTNLLGVARVLNGLKHRPNHVTLVFQPAEEGGAGGKKMCDEGVLDGDAGAGVGPRVGAMYGLHGWPQLPLGVLATRPGPLLAATDNFVVTVKGTQSHAAYPQLSRDPIVAAAHVVTALQTIASRNVGPLESVVVTVGQIVGGTARNIIPEEVRLVGTVRTLSAEVRVIAKERFFAIVEGTARALGCEARIQWDEGYPVTNNEPGATEHFFKVAKRTFGDARVGVVEHPTMGGEDFSYYGLRVPACFFVLGLCPPARVRADGMCDYPSLHQPEFDFVDAAMSTGIEAMCALALSER